MKLSTNVGLTDRLIRMLLALTLFIVYFVQKTNGALGIILIAAGVILLTTSFISFCPLYMLFRFNTKGKTRTDN